MRAIIIIAAAFLMAGCMDTVKPIPQNANTTTPNSNAERPQTAIAHSSENQTPPPAPAEKSKWTQSGDPIDTTKLDAAIMSAEKTLAAKPSDAAAKKALAAAFLARATALTEARQYASALGDYRRTLKHDPTNAEAKQWIDQIIAIYAS